MNRREAETVLVVEDDDAIRGYCTDVLREFGYRLRKPPMLALRLRYWIASRTCAFYSPI